MTILLLWVCEHGVVDAFLSPVIASLSVNVKFDFSSSIFNQTGAKIKEFLL